MNLWGKWGRRNVKTVHPVGKPECSCQLCILAMIRANAPHLLP